MTRRLVVILSSLTLVASLLASTVQASEPAESTLTVPTRAGQTDTSEWTGTAPIGENFVITCQSAPEADEHALTLEVPDLPETLTYEIEFTITWEPQISSGTNDLKLQVVDADGETVVTQDGSSTTETAMVEELAAGTYTVLVCGWNNNTPQDYQATATARTKERGRLPAAVDPGGLAFSAAIPADIQRDEGEPLIEISPSGRIYTCGPTGFSQAEDYWQVSEDGGDQFHLLGEPPRGQHSLGGGGDCAMAISPTENDQGFHHLSYVGLSGLLEFATARSSDGGHTLEANAFSMTGAGVDRQWTVATSDDRVHLNFNRVLPNRQTEVCTSTDGGLSYPSCQAVSPSPLFPGPMKQLPAEQNPFGDDPLVYYPWTDRADDPYQNMVLLAVSFDDGETWNNCRLATTKGQPGLSFPVADHDAQGEAIHVVYADKADFNTYMTSVRVADLGKCNGGTEDQAEIKETDPGATPPVVVNREGVPTTVFPWIAAGGEPGRVAVTFYGTPTDVAADAPTDPETTEDDRTWNVYVNQSLNALSETPAFSQVEATTHPNHYDQICLLGLGCTAGGDRSLVDFFSIDHNPTNGELLVTFQRAHKRPGDTTGTLQTPLVFRQISGPSNSGGAVSVADHEPLRQSSTDPTGDALADYSSLFSPPTTTNTAGADITKVEIVDPIDPETGEPFADGGFTVDIHVDDLSDAALRQALEDTQSQSLLFIFRMVDGFRYSAAVASWNPFSGFRFGHNEYVGNPGECALVGTESGDQCLLYPGSTSIPGVADQESGIIRMTVPLSFLTALEGLPAGPQEFPEEVDAHPGDRIYTSAAYSLGNFASPDAEGQSWLYPIDNTAAMDFLIPGAPGPGGGGGTTGGGASGETDGGSDDVTPVTGGGAAAVALALAGLGAVALRRREG